MIRQGEAALLRDLQFHVARWAGKKKEAIKNASPEDRRVIQDILNLLEGSITHRHDPFKLKFYLEGRGNPPRFSFSKNVERAIKEYGFPTEQGIQFVEDLSRQRFGKVHCFKVTKVNGKVHILEKHDSVPREIPWAREHYEIITR